MMATVTFADALRHYRKDHSLKQSDIAKVIGTRQQTVAKWEAGESAPHPRYLNALAQLLGIDERELVALINSVPEAGISLRDRIDTLEANISFMTTTLTEMQFDMLKLASGIRELVVEQQAKHSMQRDGRKDPRSQSADQ